MSIEKQQGYEDIKDSVHKPQSFEELFNKLPFKIEEKVVFFQKTVENLIKKGFIQQEDGNNITKYIDEINNNNRNAVKDGVYVVANNYNGLDKKVS